MSELAGEELLTIRNASLADADAIALVHYESWNSGAGKLLSPDILALRTVEYQQTQWRNRLGRRDAMQATLVAEDGMGLLGFVNVSASVSNAQIGEVNKLFVRPRHQGRGVGDALLRAGTDVLIQLGFTRAVLWVRAGNEPAVAFYRKKGWIPTGVTRDFRIDQTDVMLPAVQYRRDL